MIQSLYGDTGSLRPKEKAAEEDDQSGGPGPGRDAEPKAIPLPGTGDRFPVVGYGTWTNYQSKPEEMYRCVKAAIDAGYRHFDCAWVYDNEDEVGQAVNEKIEDGTVTRMDIFITTKIWTTYHARNRVKINLEKSLIKLQTPYVDLLLIHWPLSLKDGDDNFPHTSDGKLIFSKHDLEETWQGMEDCMNLGLTRNIGLANFNSQQVQRILDCATLKPCNLQIEVNPTLTNEKLIEVNPTFSNEKLVKFALSRNIVVTAYAPLGSPERPWQKKEDPNALEDPVIKKIAIAKGKSPAQVMLRWIVQKNMCFCVKSLHLEHIRDDIDPCPVLPCPALSCPALSCPALSCPVLPCPALSCPVLSCPVLPCPVLSCPALPCPVLPCPVLPCPVLSCPALPYPALSCPVLSCPALSCPALPCPILPCPVLPCPTLSCPALSCPALSCRALSCPVMSCRAVPCPTLSCPIFNFELTAQEMKKICGLNKNFRTYKLALTATHPEYPFHKEF
ncbi:hypothetical protein ACOMHN_059264 [Nucella lapillus]